MLLLSKLKWDVSAVVATDYIDHLLARLHLIMYDKPTGTRATVTLEDALRQHASTFISLCATGKFQFIFSKLTKCMHSHKSHSHTTNICFIFPFVLNLMVS